MRLEVGLSKSMQIAQVLEHEIRTGRLSRGDRLASENALVRRFSVSRNTVRKGLEHLARQGLITTRSGIGSFVNHAGIGSFVTFDGAAIDDAAGWTLALSKTAGRIETRVLNIERRPCAETSHLLKLEPGDFLCVDRHRRVSESGLGLSLERSRSPWRDEYYEALEGGLLKGSLGETFGSAGLVIDHGEEWAEVLPALGAADAKLMGRSVGEPMLRLRRVTRTAGGDVVEFVESLLDPARFGLHLEF